MADWIGLGFIILLATGVILGLRLLAGPVVRTEEEFEKGASQGASMVTAGVEAINGLLNPSAAKGKQAVTEFKEGRFASKKREGKGLGRGQKENK